LLVAEAGLHVVGKARRVGHVPAQHRLGRDLIHVLPARPAGAREAPHEFIVRNTQAVVDLEHNSLRILNTRTATVLFIVTPVFRCVSSNGGHNGGIFSLLIGDAVMWTCPKCKIEVEPDFDVCWSCGTSREGDEDPDFDPEFDGIMGADDFEAERAARTEEKLV